MRLVEIRPGVFRMEITVQELSALVAGARLSLSGQSQPDAGPAQDRDALESVISQFDAALKRSREGGEDEEGPAS